MEQYVGLMSGTSLDGVDAVLVAFDSDHFAVTRTSYLPYPEDLKQDLLAMHEPSHNELERCQLLCNRLARLYAETIEKLLAPPDRVHAIGCHGQTIRHRPDLGFTLQLNNPSLLAELTGIPVVADFRSRDIAAGGQGAPLVPAFHQAAFAHPSIHRVILNIGGISNLTDLPPGGTITGFDCGPGNLLMDAWCQRHTGMPFDRDGGWANSGKVIDELLAAMMAHPFFRQSPPKSTGRDTFSLDWLQHQPIFGGNAQDMQATLLELTARSIADAITQYCSGAKEIYLCGGGTHNHTLASRLAALLPTMSLAQTDTLGIPADWVEAAAFAWLAKQTLAGLPGNLPAVTGAAGPRVLGAIYPA